MAFFIKVIKGIRNHWKKSTFAAGATLYGASYAHDKYKIHELMRKYCEEAVVYGDEPQDVLFPLKRVVVILNPAAGKRSAEKSAYCAPILHLAGLLVDIVQTDSEGHACRYVEELEKLPDIIVVAGGDGTLSETITGLLRRPKGDKCQLGVLPLGRTNSVAKKHFNFSSNTNRIEKVRQLADASAAVVREKTTKIGVMEIQVINPELEEPPRPIYAAGSIEWGAFRDALCLRDKYWVFGPLREYMSSIFNAFGNKLTWQCNAHIIYTPPCTGCNNCIKKKSQSTQSTGRWWSRFIPKFSQGPPKIQEIDYSTISNVNCAQEFQSDIKTVDFAITINNDRLSNISEMKIQLGEIDLSSMDFILESWDRLRNNQTNIKKEWPARTIQLIPETMSSESKELYYSIDNEAYEVRSIRVTLIPKAVDFFTL